MKNPNEIAQEVFDDSVKGKCLALEDCGWMNPEDEEAVWRPFAAAIRAAVKEEREACAKIAEERARHNQDCPTGCKCGDGFHVAAAIRARTP